MTVSRILYVTYDGLLDPLGQSQILPLVRTLAKRGWRLSILSFEKVDRPGYWEQQSALYWQLKEEGIHWKAFRYHKRFSVVATLFDMLRAAIWTLRHGKGFDLVHLRSYPLGPPVWNLSRLLGVPYLFDMRGLWVQERVDGNLWLNGTLLVKLAQYWERTLLNSAAAIVTLTQASIDSAVLNQAHLKPRIQVIPTLVDLQRFRLLTEPRKDGELRFVYHGSLGTWYDSDALLQVERILRVEGGTLTVITNDEDHPAAKELMAAGCIVYSCSHADIPQALAQMDAAVFFINPMPSKIASSPTKLGEALASGLPVITGPGIGDVDALLLHQGVGVVCDPADNDALRAAIREIDLMMRDPSVRDKCRRIAEETFGLDEISTRYEEIYVAVITEVVQ